MSDETRETRLLRFRPREDADADLASLLAEWEAPSEPPGSAATLLSKYREAAPRPAPRHRFLTSRVGVPLPVAACFVLALAASLLAHAWGRRPAPQSAPVATDAAAPAAPAERAAPEVRYVEVPVPGETRVVYVEKRRPGAGARRAKGDVARARGGSSAGDAASYYTPVDMAEFKPSDEVKIRVVRKGER